LNHLTIASTGSACGAVGLGLLGGLFSYSILEGVIVIVTAAFWFAVIFVAAHSTSGMIRNNNKYLALSAGSVNRSPSERPMHLTLIHNCGGARPPRSAAAEKINAASPHLHSAHEAVGPIIGAGDATLTVVYRYLFWHIQRGDRECADIDDLCHPAEVQ
jgi:hypothetical protein